MIHARVDDEDGGGNSCGIPKSDHGEEGSYNHRWYVGVDGSWRGFEGIWDAYSSHIYWSQAEYGVAVSGSIYDFRIMYTGAGIRGRGSV